MSDVYGFADDVGKCSHIYEQGNGFRCELSWSVKMTTEHTFFSRNRASFGLTATTPHNLTRNIYAHKFAYFSNKLPENVIRGRICYGIICEEIKSFLINDLDLLS